MKQIQKFRRMAKVFWAFRTGQTKLNYYPMRLWIEPTNSCNLKCPLCPQSEDDWQARGYLDYDLFCKIIDEVGPHVNDINLTHRGESLFNKRVYDMIAYAHARNVKVRLHTNATPLNTKNIDLLLGAGLDFLSISFDGYDKEGYEAARLGATYEDTLGKVLALLGRKKQLGLKAPYTVLQVIEGSRLTPRQERVKSDLERLLRRASLDKFYVKSAHNWAGNIDEQKVGGEPKTAVAKKDISACTFLWYSLTIQYNGMVNPCPQDWYGEMPLGDLNKQSVWDVWNGEPLVKLRQKMLDQDLQEYPVCQKCDRICRPTTLGIPHENLKNFATENLIGYKYLSRFVHR